MSLLDLTLLPLRIARHVADVVVRPASPAPPAELVVVDGMPEGVPPAARKPEPKLPVPSGWPFGEEFPVPAGRLGWPAGRCSGPTFSTTTTVRRACRWEI
ncbi:hypothetical protein BZL29_8078 [Mycobacterium kansasii]|uniref:Uncharacterized protein n=1 Tax=Mycobacterium kansasii TaxID=1768 RepID=A0A1V3WCX6_MYCKA|nr:hypothetical protein BZL29_8078 [Mycobacterium kansasii]